MRSFVQNFLTAKPNPIGIDFGTNYLRLAQLRKDNGQLRLLAAGQLEVPKVARKDWSSRIDFFLQGVNEILSGGEFVGRQVILGLPAAQTHVGHLRLPKMEADALTKALPWEIRGKLPIEPNEAVIRHIVAGEVFAEQEPRDEVIVMACRRDLVQGLLAAAPKAKLDVVGMNVEMAAIVECFAQVYRRKGDTEAINCFLDIGFAGSRVIISRGRDILFVRSIGMGCNQLNAIVARELAISTEEAATRRLRLAQTPAEEPSLVAVSESIPVGGTLDDRRQDLRDLESDSPAAEELAMAGLSTVNGIVEELTLCRRYYEAAFPGKAIDRLIFIGGGALDRRFCQEIARGMGLPAQVGDALTRMEGREIIDDGTKRPQPGWAVALGLSAGGLL
ncbi:MAG TPA: pilus assembly protein PilM [Tepidisphaeraceae bacterium]|jgi:Tfp pilus assembly PilM family ATPase